MLDAGLHDHDATQDEADLRLHSDRARSIREGALRLTDGRSLAWIEYGDPNGHPVVYCHGFPGSRFEAAIAHRAAQRVNARILSFDRPGYGRSDHQPGRTILDWPRDIESAADQLGLARFAVLGVSGGGPYALACAHALRQRLTGIAIVCGLGPAHDPALRRAMMWLLRTGLFLGLRAPQLLEWIYAVVFSPLPRWHPQGVFKLLAAHTSHADRASLRNRETRAALVASLREAFRRGSHAAVSDIVLYAHDWGFAPESIEATVHLWHGEADPTVPVSMGRTLAARLPRCRARFLPGEGHFSLPVNHAADILRALTDRPDSSPK
jgi:pimeloyl-ACP methyl ester carboxylesterase